MTIRGPVSIADAVRSHGLSVALREPEVIATPDRRPTLEEKLAAAREEYAALHDVETPLGSVRLHHWLSGDDDRCFHDHQWWFVTFVLAGGYIDINPSGSDRVSRWSFRLRKAEHRHTVEVDKSGCWTIMLTGPRRRRWGFWRGSKFIKANKYFLENGSHQCR